MYISCINECDYEYKFDIKDCHYIYEAETVAFTDNSCLILCIRNAEYKYQDCSK